MASSWWHWLECWQWHVLHYRDVWGVQSSGGPLPSLPRGLLVIGKCLQIKLPLNIVITRVWAGADDWSHQMNVWQCLTSDHQLGWGLIGPHRVIYCSHQDSGVTGEYSLNPMLWILRQKLLMCHDKQPFEVAKHDVPFLILAAFIR